MKTPILLLVLSAALLGACRQETFEERCAREAREFTEKQCPRRLDPFTMMDSIVYDRSSRTVLYFYTLDGLMDVKVSFMQKLHDELQKLLIENVVNSTELKQHKESKMNFAYKYFSKSSGDLLFEVRVTPEDYQTNK